ncbi:unnamed protein product [Ceutorhynchus assimilis]|uniref:Regulatory protein zeste n=1 Tax=Ceutorhynchus assimilis TaxID=467358 RepID=A0A9N9MKU9_9CUCU|nr:unnamed protein product [Ceutorhynchus assimilis]
MASRPTPKHWEIILDWLERNPEMVSGRGIGPTGKSNLKEKWENLAITLNSLGYTNKSAEKWMKTWTDFKCNLKRKAADIKKEQNKTGGGPSTSKALNEFEERALQLLGSTFIGLAKETILLENIELLKEKISNLSTIESGNIGNKSYAAYVKSPSSQPTNGSNSGANATALKEPNSNWSWAAPISSVANRNTHNPPSSSHIQLTNKSKHHHYLNMRTSN